MFHPEVETSKEGKDIIDNFLLKYATVIKAGLWKDLLNTA